MVGCGGPITEQAPPAQSTDPTGKVATVPVWPDPPDSGPLDCSPIDAADAEWQLCFEGEEHCEAIYTDGSGCHAVCAAVDLPCTGAYENRDDSCSPNQSRSPLSCDSGHQSDYCICGGTGLASVEDPGGSRIDSLLEERAGFGGQAAGGDPALIFTVNTLADSGPGSLRQALESTEPWSIVFEVDGLIYWEDPVQVRSNKTVDGRGSDITVDGTWRLQDVHDVILSDLTLTRSIHEGEEACEQAGDAVTVRGSGGASPSDFSSHDLWFHHLDFRNGGDGLIDIRGGTQITISWSHFSDHKKVTLAWQDEAGLPTQGMQVTWHHNHFDHTTVRNPRFHYGKAHYVNNFLDEWWQSGAASYDAAQFFSEANIYLAADDCVGIPQVSPCEDLNPCAVNNDWFVDRSLAVVTSGSSASGYVASSGDLLLNGAQIEIRQASSVFDPYESYDFTPDPATEGLAATIKAQVGPRTAWTK